MRARGPGSPAPPLTPASGSIPHPQPSPPLPRAVGRMLVLEGKEEGRKACCEALRGRGAGRQAQEVSPWPAVWPATYPRAWRHFSLKLGSQLLPRGVCRGRGASLPPTPHCLVRALVPQAWGKHLLRPGPGRRGSRHMGTSRQRPWGLWEPARLGPRRGRGRRPLWTEQAPPSCSGPWSRHPWPSLRRLSPQESPSWSRAGSFLPPHGGRGPGSSHGPGLLSGLALRASAAGAFEASPHTPLLEGRGCG